MCGQQSIIGTIACLKRGGFTGSTLWIVSLLPVLCKVPSQRLPQITLRRLSFTLLSMHIYSIFEMESLVALIHVSAFCLFQMYTLCLRVNPNMVPTCTCIHIRITCERVTLDMLPLPPPCLPCLCDIPYALPVGLSSLHGSIPYPLPEGLSSLHGWRFNIFFKQHRFHI